MSLVEDYGSDSEDETVVEQTPQHSDPKEESDSNFDPLGIKGTDNIDTSSSSDESSESVRDSPAESELLPLPDLDALPGKASVFVNPYQEAEQAKLSVLKQHVTELAPEAKNEGKKFPKRKGKFKRQQEPEEDEGLGKQKIRCGVGDSLKPAKKFMKIHTEIQSREKPWTKK